MNETEIEELLPWYAAGALSDEEKAEVEAALARRPDLRRSLATVHEDRDETVALNEAFGAPSPAAWARVMQGVEAAPRRASLSARIAGWLGLGAERRSPWLAVAGAAAAVVILLQAATIVTMSRAGKSGYATVTSASSTADALAAFAGDAKFADVAELLKANQATIVGGPRGGGLYELRIGASKKAEVEAALKALSASPLVKMALPGSR